MKKAVLFTFLICILFSVTAQDYKGFKFGWRYGYTTNVGESLGGLTFDLEPAVRINYYTLVFFRLESFLAEDSRTGIITKSMDATAISVGGQYYLFEKGKFRLYAGIGIGFHYPFYSEESQTRSADVTKSTTVEFDSKKRNFVHPRIGFDLGHFNFLIDFNLIPSSDGIRQTSIYDRNTNNSTSTEEKIEVKNSNISIKVGVSFGGGRR